MHVVNAALKRSPADHGRCWPFVLAWYGRTRLRYWHYEKRQPVQPRADGYTHFHWFALGPLDVRLFVKAVAR